MRLSLIVRPHGRLSSPQRRCNSVKENVANKEPGKRGGGEEARAASWFIRPGQRCGNALGTSVPAQSAAADGQSRQASLLGRAPHPVSSQCKRLTQPGSKGSGVSRATRPAPPHLTPPPPAGGTNLFQQPEVDKCETCRRFPQDWWNFYKDFFSLSYNSFFWPEEMKSERMRS